MQRIFPSEVRMYFIAAVVILAFIALGFYLYLRWRDRKKKLRRKEERARRKEEERARRKARR